MDDDHVPGSPAKPGLTDAELAIHPTVFAADALKDQVVVVSGGAGGIGRGVVPPPGPRLVGPRLAVAGPLAVPRFCVSACQCALASPYQRWPISHSKLSEFARIG